MSSPLPVLYEDAFRLSSISSPESYALQQAAMEVVKICAAKLHNKVFLLSSTRGRIDHIVATGVDSDSVGVQGQYLMHLLAKMFGKREYERVASKVSAWAEKFGIAKLRDEMKELCGINILSPKEYLKN